mgnify:CR=1 FL=1
MYILGFVIKWRLLKIPSCLNFPLSILKKTVIEYSAVIRSFDMKKKLKLGFADTHEHLATFFYSILSTRYDIELDNDNPEFLLFGDENFGTRNLSFSKDKCVKVFYTGENRRPQNYDCHYAISFDHIFEPWHYRLPLFVVYAWAMKYIHKLPYEFFELLNCKPKEKTGFCSFVVSNPNGTERNEFFHKLNAIKRVDSAGRHLKNINIDLSGEMAKDNFIASRKFSKIGRAHV